MASLRFPRQVVAVTLLTLFLVGCSLPAGILFQLPSMPPTPTAKAILPPPPPPGPQPPGVPNRPAGGCSPDQVSSIAVLRSRDRGATWTAMGAACIQGLRNVKPADPTGLVVDGRIWLYFTDLSVEQPKTLYLTTSIDGINFDTPKPTFTMDRLLYDPFVLRMPDRSFRAYIPTGPEGIISAKSGDGLRFVQEDGARGKGEMPGAVVLSDNRIRMFSTEMGNHEWISSAVSRDGLTFTPETGARVSKPTDYLYINNPQPIRLADDSYLMLYQIQDKKHEGRPDWKAEIHLAVSKDGLTWATSPRIIEYGGTSCVVEAPDGALLIYYGY